MGNGAGRAHSQVTLIETPVPANPSLQRTHRQSLRSFLFAAELDIVSCLNAIGVSRPEERRAAGWNPAASALLVAFLLVAHSGFGLYAARKIQPSPLFTLLYYFALAGLLAYWVHCDRLRTHASSSLDEGMYFYFTWPLALPVYLFKSRGIWRGLGALSLFILAFACAYGLSIAVWVIAGGRR